jgi:hydroxymethylglutaryl-CoA lyase
MNPPDHVKIVEVGPRDGLQNEKKPVSTSEKIKLINLLVESGLQAIEVGSFVSKKHVPQMADSAAVYAGLDKHKAIAYPVLVPNQRGYEDAQAAGVAEIAVFAAVSETFSQKNIGCSIDQSMERFAAITANALQQNIKVRGYLSCVLGCPYEGEVNPDAVVALTQRLLEAGCYEISLGDTIGIGTPGSTETLLRALLKHNIDPQRLAIHCHNTYGQAIGNILVALQHGVSTVDASVSGLGGCPFAPGASGNVATEDVIYMLDGYGIEHGVDLTLLIKAGSFISGVLQRNTQSQVARAVANRHQAGNASA